MADNLTMFSEDFFTVLISGATVRVSSHFPGNEFTNLVTNFTNQALPAIRNIRYLIRYFVTRKSHYHSTPKSNPDVT